MITVKDIMTKRVTTVKRGMDVRKLAKLFVKKGISGAPVVGKKGEYLGIVLEEGLIIRDKNVHIPTFIYLLSGFITLGENRFEEEMRKIAATTVAGIMEKRPYAVSPDTRVDDIATMMVEKSIHYFPVLSKGKLVGVVTKKDIVRAIAQKRI